MTSALWFRLWPYAATVLFAIGMVLRYAIARRRSRRHGRSFEGRDGRGGPRLLQFSLLLLLVGHLVGFLFPHWLLQWNSSVLRLYATETLGFVLGLLALGGWAVMMWRHLWHSNGTPIRQAADAVLLSVLFTVLLSGSLMAILFRWGSSWGVLTLTPYAVSLFRGRPAVGLMIDMPFLVRLHVFAAFAMLALLPATPLALLMVIALRRLLGPLVTAGCRMLGPLQTLVERLMRRVNPASLIWPEED